MRFFIILTSIQCVIVHTSLLNLNLFGHRDQNDPSIVDLEKKSTINIKNEHIRNKNPCYEYKLGPQKQKISMGPYKELCSKSLNGPKTTKKLITIRPMTTKRTTQKSRPSTKMPMKPTPKKTIKPTTKRNQTTVRPKISSTKIFRTTMTTKRTTQKSRPSTKLPTKPTSKKPITTTTKRNQTTVRPTVSSTKKLITTMSMTTKKRAKKCKSTTKMPITSTTKGMQTTGRPTISSTEKFNTTILMTTEIISTKGTTTQDKKENERKTSTGTSLSTTSLPPVVENTTLTPPEDDEEKFRPFANYTMNQINFYRKNHSVPLLTKDFSLSLESEMYSKEQDKNNTKSFFIVNNTSVIMGEKSLKKNEDLVVHNWYDQIKKYDFKKPNLTMENQNFVAMMYKNATNIGCSEFNTSDTFSVYITCIIKIIGDFKNDFKENVLKIEDEK
uniref:SCP domain-containing protein n=1 Tax=Parastrongyloides trichosuri TaxID=131310 RepID=A0A0N4ZDW6_PARTI